MAARRLAKLKGRRPTLPPGLPGSTIGAGGLNFSVRNGKRCFPSAKTTPILNYIRQSKRDVGERRVQRLGEYKTGQASRQISTGRLKSLRTLHLPPIDVVVSDAPSGGMCHG